MRSPGAIGGQSATRDMTASPYVHLSIVPLMSAEHEAKQTDTHPRCMFIHSEINICVRSSSPIAALSHRRSTCQQNTMFGTNWHVMPGCLSPPMHSHDHLTLTARPNSFYPAALMTSTKPQHRSTPVFLERVRPQSSPHIKRSR